MASTIPGWLKQEIEEDPFYKVSCLTNRPGSYGDRIVFHHVFTYGGKQINEKFAIVPLIYSEHDFQSRGKSVHNDAETRERVELISLNRASEEELRRFNLTQKKKYLSNKYK